MEIVYSNDLGTLKLLGKGGGVFSVCEIKGLEMPEKSRVLKTYIGEDGRHEDSSQFLERIISVSGDIELSKDANAPKKAARILSHPGRLCIENNGEKRYINVNSASFSLGKRYEPYLTFAMQFTCDYPHFTDGETVEQYVFKKINMISYDTALPAMFSRRICEGVVDNGGDIRIYPIITIEKKSDFGRENTIVIENETTGKSITLVYEMSMGEKICLNIKDRTITSSQTGLIMGSLDLYSSLADIWCECNENLFSVSIDGTHDGIEVKFQYENEYTEAL